MEGFMIRGLHDSWHLLRTARMFDNEQAWIQSEAVATEILAACPSNVDALMIRARARRFMGNLSGAMDDYREVCKLEPQDAYAWLGQGAISIQRALELYSLDERLKVMSEQVYPCYRSAAGLSPNDGEIGLSLLELEICIGRHREAVSTIGTWWNRLQLPRHTIIGAWLGAIALILAGKPERRWMKFKNHLLEKTIRLEPLAWVTTEITNYIKHLESAGCGHEKLASIREIHELFLEHFGPAGPLS
jgi:hypothetical protein